MKKLPAVFAVLLVLSFAAPAGEKPVVGLVLKSLANEFFKTVAEGARQFAEEDGSFTLVTVGMNSETDIGTQIDAVERFAADGVDMIVIAPANSVELVPAVKKAVDAGIPVINFDVMLDKPALAANGLPEDFLFVGPDNELGAKLAGDFLAEKLGRGAKVAVIEGHPGADSAVQRKAGFMKAVEQYEFELLASETAEWETDTAASVMAGFLADHKDIQGVLCANDSMAVGAVRAIEAAGLGGTIDVVGFDNTEACRQLIREGRMLATVDQFGPLVAVNAIKIGFRVLGGEKLSGWIRTPAEVVSAQNF